MPRIESHDMSLIELIALRQLAADSTGLEVHEPVDIEHIELHDVVVLETYG